MLDETVARIESIVHQAEMEQPVRDELTGLVRELKEEVVALEQSRPEHARSIAGHAQMSAFEVTRTERDQTMIQHTLEGLSRSVEQFEISHPRLTETVNAIHRLLSTIGLG